MPERPDHHLHFDYAWVADGSPDDPALVLYLHSQQSVIPGWLDKFSKHRQRATAQLSNVVVLSPNLAWVATLPNAKLPDHADFRFFGDETRRRRPDQGKLCLSLHPAAKSGRNPGQT